VQPTEVKDTPLKNASDHEFGSQDTDLKLSIIENYLKAFTTALRGKFPGLWYIDAFAGTGLRTVRVAAKDGDLLDEPVPEHVEQRRGSAQIAIDVIPPFNRLVFMEQKPRHCVALRALRAKFPNRDIEILEGDANKSILSEVRAAMRKRVRAVMFLDPYGMDVEWKTLEAIAESRVIDVWYLFSLSGLYRQAARRADAIDPHKRAAITRMLGTSAWERELYAPSPQERLFDEPVEIQRTSDVRGLENYVKARLKSIFPEVLNPLALPVNRRPQMFSLFFAISNRQQNAIGLAARIAGQILKAGRSSQVRPR